MLSKAGGTFPISRHSNTKMHEMIALNEAINSEHMSNCDAKIIRLRQVRDI